MQCSKLGLTVGFNGVWGVVTYDIAGTGMKVAVMFSVPFNELNHKHYYNYKVRPHS